MIFETIQFRKFVVLSYLIIVGFSFLLLFFGLIPAIIAFSISIFIYLGLTIIFPTFLKKERFLRFFSLILSPQYYYIVFVILTLFLALIIRLYNLTVLDPYTDEWIHLGSAWRLSEVGVAEYPRAYFLAFIIHWLFEIFGKSIFIARIPGVIFGSLTIIPLFLLTKRISMPVGAISILLWAISPWAIMMSRNIREYAFFPFFILIILLILVSLTDKIISYCDRKYSFTITDIGSALVVVFCFFYAQYIDPFSTFKYIFLILPPFGIYFCLRTFGISNDVIKKKIQYPVFLLIIVLLLIALFIGLFWNNLVSFTPIYNEFYINLLLKSDGTQWYWDKGISTIGVVLLLLFGSLYFGIFKKQLEFVLIFLIFIFTVYFYSFHWDRYNSTRNFYYVLPFFTIIIASGIYTIYHGINQIKFYNLIKTASIFLFLFVIIMIFNPLTTVTTVTWNEQFVPMTGITHPSISQLFYKYHNEIDKDDILITSYTSTMGWIFNFSPGKDSYPVNNQYVVSHIDTANPNIYLYNSKSESTYDLVFKIINIHKRGWIIIDTIITNRNNEGLYPLPLNDFLINDIKVKYHGRTDLWDIYSWNKIIQD